MKDLVILAADKDMEFALRGLLARPAALGIRPVDVDFFVEPAHDPGCALHGVEFLSHLEGHYRHALLLFDHEGSGKEKIPREDLQASLNEAFGRSIWRERARAIVIAPELESWIWSESPQVDEILGWKDREPGLRQWCTEKGWLREGQTKPDRPKEAFLEALRVARKPRSSSLFRRIAERVSAQRCTDPAFLELGAVLTAWFPIEKGDA